jgi:hypothetical protein
MAKTGLKKLRKLSEVELEPDAWARFAQFIRDIAKAGPQHSKPAKPKSRAAKIFASTAKKKTPPKRAK